MIVKRRVTILAAAAIALCAIAVPASAQLTTASVAGTVKDQRAAVIPGAAALYTEVLVPDAVARELRQSSTLNQSVPGWSTHRPGSILFR